MMKIKKHLLLLALCTCILPNAFNQVNADSLNKIFEEFKSNIQLEFNQFKSSNDSIFVGFLRKSWEEYDLMITERPAQPKPQQQPTIKEDDQKVIELIPLKKIEIKIDNYTIDSLKKRDLAEKNAFSLFRSETKFECELYGTNIEFSLSVSDLPQLKEVSNTGIADFYEDASNSASFKSLLQSANIYKQQLKLNGWAYLKLCEQMSKEVYPDKNMQVLTMWYLLINSGQMVKSAYNEDEIYLLCGFDSPIYNMSYCNINNEPYYLYSFGGLQQDFNKFFTYKENHNQQTEAVSLYLFDSPGFEFAPSIKNLNFKGQRINIQMNKNLIDFYSGYPDCALQVTLNAPLSDQAFSSLDSFLSKKMDSLSVKNKVEYLLNFVQQALPYKNDIDQFGKEDYLFADETLNYPYCDCEDRVALMAQLVKKHTGLKCIGLNFPGHVSFAVNLNEEINGTFINVNGTKYYICDPTYIGAKCGMIMPEYATAKAEIIHLN